MLKPLTIIRNLEDSPDWLDQKLLEAYWRTEYRVGINNPAPNPSPTGRGDVENTEASLNVFSTEHTTSPLPVGEGLGVGLRLTRAHPPALSDWLIAENIRTYAFITASNPRSKLLSEQENVLRNRTLERDLKKVSRFVFPGLGIGSDGNWPAEESFWALDISPENAVALGRKYGQNALVWWEEGGLPELWWLG